MIAYTNSKGSGEPALPRSLARSYAIRSRKRYAKQKPTKELDRWRRYGAGHAYRKMFSTESAKDLFLATRFIIPLLVDHGPLGSDDERVY